MSKEKKERKGKGKGKEKELLTPTTEKPTKKPKEVVVFNLDLAVRENGEGMQPVCYEWGNALYAGYPGYNKMHRVPGTDPKIDLMRQKIIAHLIQRFDCIFIVAVNQTGAMLTSLGRKFVNQQEKISIFPGLESFTQFLQKSPDEQKNSLVVIDRDMARHYYKEVDFSAILKQLGVNIPVLNSSELFLLADDKIIFSDLFARNADMIPQTFILYEKNYEKIYKHIKKSNISDFIIKPQQGICSKGNILVNKQQLLPVLKTIFSQGENSIQTLKIPISEQKKLHELFELRKKTGLSSYILQERIISKKITIKHRHYLPTIRMVFCAVFNSADSTVSIEVVDGFYKLPEEPFREGETINRNNLISATTNSVSARLDTTTKELITSKLKPTLTNVFQRIFDSNAQRYLIELADRDPRLCGKFIGLISGIYIHKISTPFVEFLHKANSQIASKFLLSRLFHNCLRLGFVRTPKVLNTDLFNHITNIEKSPTTSAIRFLDETISEKATQIVDFLLKNQYIATYFSKQPELTKPFFNAFETLVKLSRFANNSEKLTEIRQLRPPKTLPTTINFKKLSEEALSAYKQKNFYLAIQIYSELITLTDNKNIAMWYSNLASCYRDKGETSKAIKYCRDGLKIQKNNSSIQRSTKLIKKLKDCNKLHAELKIRKSSYNTIRNEYKVAISENSNLAKERKLRDVFFKLMAEKNELNKNFPDSTIMSKYKFLLGLCQEKLNINQNALSYYREAHTLAVNCLGANNQYTRRCQRKVDALSSPSPDTPKAKSPTPH